MAWLLYQKSTNYVIHFDILLCNFTGNAQNTNAKDMSENDI